MEDEISRFFKFKWSKNKFEAIALVLIILGLILGGGYFLHKITESPHHFCDSVWDVYVNLFASLCAFVAAFLIISFISWVYRKHEDELKVSYKNSKMLGIYKNKYEDKIRKSFHPYRKSFSLHPGVKKECIVYFDKLFLHKKVGDFTIEDYPNRYFEVNTFIDTHAAQLLGAHSGSTTSNEFTPRLEDFVPASTANNKHTLVITRSTYVNHLLTNRAMDYQLGPDVSLRRLYESIDVLTSLPLSKMSNHIGINALVFLKEKQKEASQEQVKRYLIVPHRGKDATVVKNGITASIATRLKLDDKYKKAAAKGTLEQYIEKGCIEQSMERALLLTKDGLDAVKKAAEIHFLGLARDPYEGGKPTLFYYVELDMKREQFWDLTKPNYKKGEIDEIEELVLVEWDNIILNVPDPTLFERAWKEIKKFVKKLKNEEDGDLERDQEEALQYDKAKLQLKPYYKRPKKDTDPKEGIEFKEDSFIFEQNMITNFWFYLNHAKQIK